MEDTKEILIKARKLLVTKGWCKHAMAVNKDGKRVLTNSPSAVSYCIIGAVCAVSNVDRTKKPPKSQIGQHLLVLNQNLRGYLSLSAFNDSPYTTKLHIVNFFDEVIASL